MNVAKTKELIVDYRRSGTPRTPVSIQGGFVDIVEDYIPGRIH